MILPLLLEARAKAVTGTIKRTGTTLLRLKTEKVRSRDACMHAMLKCCRASST